MRHWCVDIQCVILIAEIIACLTCAQAERKEMFKFPVIDSLYCGILTFISSPCHQSLLESFNKVKAAEEAVIEKKYGSMDPVERFRAERSAAAGKAMWAERKERAGKEVV